jgi:hypothetical protein
MRGVTSDGAAWTFSDAWVMTGVAIAGDDGCDLAELIAAADACNHAILTADELTQGVGRLTASGLLAHDDTRFRLTAVGQQLAARRQGSMFSQVDSVRRLLAEVPLTKGGWSVSSEDIDSAYATYIKRQRGRA